MCLVNHPKIKSIQGTQGAERKLVSLICIFVYSFIRSLICTMISVNKTDKTSALVRLTYCLSVPGSDINPINSTCWTSLAPFSSLLSHCHKAGLHHLLLYYRHNLPKVCLLSILPFSNSFPQSQQLACQNTNLSCKFYFKNRHWFPITYKIKYKCFITSYRVLWSGPVLSFWPYLPLVFPNSLLTFSNIVLLCAFAHAVFFTLNVLPTSCLAHSHLLHAFNNLLCYVYHFPKSMVIPFHFLPLTSS